MITVITCPRPGGVSYFPGLLGALGRRDVTVILDGDGYLLSPPNNRLVGERALRMAADGRVDLLFLEDDVLPASPGAIDAMEAHLVPSWAAWTSFYGARAPGRYGAGAFYCSQTVKIPQRTLAEVLARTKGWAWQSATGIDLALAAVGSTMGWEFEQGEPLVRHVGAVSAAARR